MKLLSIIKECVVDILVNFEKNYRFFIGIAIICIIIWFSYDLGSVLTANNVQEEIGGRPTEQITTEKMVEKIKDYDTKKGVLYINFDGVKFKDENGTLYDVKDFKDKINKYDLAIVQNKLDVKGKAKIDIVPQNKGEKEMLSSLFLDFLTKFLWLSFYIFIFTYIIRHLVKAKSGINGRKFKIYDKKSLVKTRISDVAGQGEAKKEVIEIVDYLKAPQKYKKVGAKMPNGIILYGPSGTGKTVLAKAIAGESDANFISQSASSFIDTYVGQGAAAIRALFKEARKMKPCVIFIDEIDAIATDRDLGGSEERMQTINQLLTEMSGFENNEGIVIIAATNRIDVIDPAIMRPGRFDRKVLINLPNEQERVEILNIYIQTDKISNDVDIEKIAKKTISFSGAELENLVNEAAIEAARQNKEKIEMNDFDLARDRILMGTKNSRKPNTNESKVLAYHELGHAIISSLNGIKVEKVSIIPRGLALGVTINETKDSILRTKEDLKNDIVNLMGGRAAEELFCNEITTGSYDDIKKASDCARQMVSVFGFNKNTPYIPLNDALKIEDEQKAQKIIGECYDEAKEILKNHSKQMEELYTILISQKEIDGSIIEETLKNKLK